MVTDDGTVVSCGMENAFVEDLMNGCGIFTSKDVTVETITLLWCGDFMKWAQHVIKCHMHICVYLPFSGDPFSDVIGNGFFWMAV